MATGGSEVASDEISEFQCFTCINKSAVKYCVECQGYLCQPCANFHSRFPSMKGHTLLDKSNFKTPGLPTTLPAVPTERCSIHTIKLMDMYCKDHDEVGCTTCMALNHRSCKNVYSIPDDIDMLLETTDIKDINQNLQSSKGAFEDIQKKKCVLLKDLDSSKKEADTAIEHTSEEFIALVKNLERKSKVDVENEYQTSKTRVEKDTKEANRQKDDLEKLVSDLQESEGNKAQQFVCMKIANRKIKEAKKVELSLKTETEAKVTFLVDPTIQEYFRNMKAIGKVSSVMPKSERTEIYTVAQYKDINVKLQGESTACNIISSCWIEDSSLLLTDYNNKKLKRANITRLSVDGYCSFDNNPYCVCYTDRQEAVVTFYTKFVQFVSVGNQLLASRKVQMNHNCLGIAFKEDKLYTTDNARKIYIHDMAGNELQAISQDSSGSGIFSCTWQIAFDDFLQYLIVADWNKGVIILDGNYQPVATFTDSGLSNASAVCTDRRGNIFVCGYNSYNVLQIGYDGKKRGVVDRSRVLQTTRSVCFDPVQCRLIVTQGNDIVKLFDLK